MEGRSGLISKLIIEARPTDIHEQNVEDTERRLINTLNEALDLGIIVEKALENLLGYIQEHLTKVRQHLSTIDYWQRNLWQLHHYFCIGLKDVFAEKQPATV